jgi:predicted phage terminase large subunit-like protein
MLVEYSLHKLDFPALLDNALASYKEYKPDRIVVEKASSGIPLYQEFRKRGIPVSPIKPQGTKYSRADAATIPLSQGIVYHPDRRWAYDLINVCAAFPAGAEDDSVDSTTMALNFARRMHMLETPDDLEDEDDEDDEPTAKRTYAIRRTRIGASAPA